jgi:hypothetical protein
MKTFIANFGRENYLWPSCRSRPSVATFEDEDTWPLWLANDREGYIARCIATKRTAKGITPTRSVASRWFNLAHIIDATENDLWIHREKNDLWWTISHSERMEVSLEPAFRPSKPSEQVYVLHKRTDLWSNKNKQGNPLPWNGLHLKAREFLFTEGTLQQLGDDNAAYALALIEGRDLSPWHSRPDWKAKAEAGGRGAVTTFNAKQRASADMAMTARNTVAGAQGQEIVRTAKIKELRFGPMQEFEKYIEALIDAQEGLCAITGLKIQYYGEHNDVQLRCSLDRIDSDGHYEAGNLQVVCRFVNRWKGDQKDGEFRRLMSLVRSAGGFG